jgi:hypothetical protein
MMKRSHAVIGAAAGVAVAHATGASMVAGGSWPPWPGCCPTSTIPTRPWGGCCPPRGGAGGTGSPLPAQ